MANDLPDAISHLEAALAIARRLGQLYSETFLSGNLMLAQIFAGDWAGAEAVADALLKEEHHGQEILHSRLVLLHALRGEAAAAREELSHLSRWEKHDSSEPRTLRLALEGTVLLSEGSPELALGASRSALEVAVPNFGWRHEIARQAWPDACEAALESGAPAGIEALLEQLGNAPSGHVPPYLEAQALRYRALVPGLPHAESEPLFRAATEAFSGLGYPYWRARTVVDLAAACSEDGSPIPPVQLAESVAEFERLGASPQVARAQRLLAEISIPGPQPGS